MLGSVDLTGVADELYAVPVSEFVARRNDLAKEAKDGGDKDLAAAVRKLTKPTTAAWVVNMLVRHDPEQVQQVLDLGAALREAQESMAGEQLRELGKQRRQLTSAVTRQARSLAVELGEKVGEAVATQVEETLHAAMVDENAAAAVRTGMLIKPLAVTGTEAGDVVGSVAVPEALGADVVRRQPAPAARKAAGTATKKPDLKVVEDDSRRIEEAEARVAEAEQELADAERRLDKARRKVEKREAKALQLEAELDELRRRIAEVEERLEVNEEQLAEAEETRDEREAHAERARTAAEEARSELEKLRSNSSGQRS